jgi:hypothetical protein
MSNGFLTRQQAHRRARIARLGFGAIAVAGAGIAVFALPSISTVPTIDELLRADPADAPVAGAAVAPAERTVAVDTDGINGRFMQFANRPRPIDPPAEEPAPVPDDQPPTPETPVDVARFLGVVREPGRDVALMSIDGSQRFMAVGDQIGNVKLLEVGDGWVRIDEGGLAKTLDKLKRSGPSITMIGSDAGGINPTTGATWNNPSLTSESAYNPGVVNLQRPRRTMPNIPAIESPAVVTPPALGSPNSPGAANAAARAAKIRADAERRARQDRKDSEQPGER